MATSRTQSCIGNSGHVDSSHKRHREKLLTPDEVAVWCSRWPISIKRLGGWPKPATEVKNKSFRKLWSKNLKDGKRSQNVLSFCWAALSSLEPFKVSSNIFRGKSRHQTMSTMFPRKVQVVSAKALFSTHLLQLSAEANFGKHQCSHTKACVDCVDGCNFALCSFLGLVEPRQECHGNWNFEIF